MATDNNKLKDHEEKTFWKEAYLAALGGLLASGEIEPSEEGSWAHNVGIEAEEHAWEAVRRMRGGS